MSNERGKNKSSKGNNFISMVWRKEGYGGQNLIIMTKWKKGRASHRKLYVERHGSK